MFVCFDDVSKSMKKLDDQRVNRWWCDIKWYCDNNVQPCTHSGGNIFQRGGKL